MFTSRYVFLFVAALALLYDQFTRRIPSRLHAEDAFQGKYGLEQVESSSSQGMAHGIDIIFVHGLGSNPDTTWGPKNQSWVKSFLPQDLEASHAIADVRIFFYNYDSYWKRDAVHTRLRSISNKLLHNIASSIRQSEEERTRGLVFVGHSYGGLVIKRALVQASFQPEFNNIAEHARAVLFLGTPHRGSTFSTWGSIAARTLWPLGSNPSLLQELTYDSIHLLDLQEEFEYIARNDLQVVNFFEQRKTKLFKVWFAQWEEFCVREQSAKFGKVNIGLDVDHYGLNKFRSRNGEYKIVLKKLQDAITFIVSQKQQLLESAQILAVNRTLSMANAYQDQGRWEEAEALQLRIFERSKRALGEEHVETLVCMFEIFMTLRMNRRHQEAEKLGEQLVAKAKKALGDEHQDTLTSLHFLAKTYGDLERWAEAERLESEVLEKRKKTLGDEHDLTLASMSALAEIYKRRRRWDIAGTLFQETIRKQKKVLGERHRDTLLSMERLATLLWWQGRGKDSEELWLQVIETRKTTLGEEHSDTLRSMVNLASILKSQEKWTEAENLETQLLEKQKKVYGYDINTANTMFSLGSLYRRQSRWKEAEKMFVEVLERRGQLLGTEHQDTLDTMTNLAVVYMHQRRWEDAETLGLQVYEISKKVLGEGHPRTLVTLDDLAFTYHHRGRPEEGEALQRQVLETRKRVLGEDHSDTLKSLESIATMIRYQGRNEEALELIQKRLEIQERTLGTDHEETKRTTQILHIWKAEDRGEEEKEIGPQPEDRPRGWFENWFFTNQNQAEIPQTRT